MSAHARSVLFVVFTTALASSISLIGGLGLEFVSQKILPLVPLIIALPALNDLVGDYASIIAAHAGDPEESKRTSRQLLQAILKVVWLNILAIIGLSLLVAYRRDYALTTDFALKFAAFVAVSILIVVLMMFVISGFLDRALVKRRFNPDEVLIPVVTSLADIAMLGLITAAVVFIF